MKLISINTSQPVSVAYNGQSIQTGIFKKPVEGPVRVGRLNLAGDGQSDLKHHGGEDKAVYAYSLDHYPMWLARLGRESLRPGSFGENLTIAGLDESQTSIGDRLEIGDVRLVVTQPRVPCFKLGILLEREDMPRIFRESGLTGCYLKVEQEGEIVAGQPVNIVDRSPVQIPVKPLFEAFFSCQLAESRALLSRALTNPYLSEDWRQSIEKRLAI